ncbi:hypothetical protein [Nocardia higoensis]|uniref:hypothetical protein n=1 Tax=Nocardia higoensis TaxID=228599 RepID=UPI0002DC1745|nr:hypothetical protein [Nocardia higoensis]
MRAPSIGTALRLSRIAALVAACLLFLHACDRTRRLLPTDVWLELAAAALLAAGAMVAAWFEIVRAERIEEAEELEANDPPAPRADDLLYDTSTHAIRARIARSGNLVIHGREHGGPYPGHEWSWTFRAETLPAVRNALGGDGDVLELLAEVVPRLDADSRADPGAWLRAHGIAGAYREKGDHPSRTTHKLPILRPGLRRAESGRARPAREESAGRGEPSEPARRSSRRPTSSTGTPPERLETPGSRDARSGSNRRADVDRAPSSRGRADAPGLESGPLRTGKNAPKRRPGTHSGPFPAAGPADSGPLPAGAQRPHAARESADEHSGPIERAAKRRPAPRDAVSVPRSVPLPTEAGPATRRGQRRDPDIADYAARPDLPRRARQRQPAEDPPETSIHGNRRSPGDPPMPGLFRARTGIDPTDTPPPASRNRSRPARTTWDAAESPTGLRVSPGEAGYSENPTYRSYDRPRADGEPRYRQPGYGAPGYATPEHNGSDFDSESAGYDSSDHDAPDSTPGLPRRRGHRYR